MCFRITALAKVENRPEGGNTDERPVRSPGGLRMAADEAAGEGR